MVLKSEHLPGLLMTIIRFVLPCNDRQIKKLLLIFWEIWPKTFQERKLLHQMMRCLPEGEGGEEGGFQTVVNSLKNVSANRIIVPLSLKAKPMLYTAKLTASSKYIKVQHIQHNYTTSD